MHEWDTRPWAVGTLCKAFYQFGDGFLYRVVAIERYEPSKLITLTLDPVISVFAANGVAAGKKKHMKQRKLGSTLCTPMSIDDIRKELIHLEHFLNYEIALNATAAPAASTAAEKRTTKAPKKKNVPVKAAKTASKRAK